MRQANLIVVVMAVILTTAKAATNWTEVDLKINEKIGEGHFTGCVLGIYTNNATLLKKAYGGISPKYGLYSIPVTVDSMFDLNFITQVIGVNSGMMQLYDLTKLNVTDKVSRYLSDFDNNGKKNLTISNLMIHNSGLQATFTDAFGATPAELLKKIDNLKL
jgi:CubicO group peptidase (beta-lactamase class C family)